MKKILTILLAACLLSSICGIGLAADARYVASKNSDKYHLATCSLAKNIDAANKVTFNSPAEAAKAGYSPCKVCNPAGTTAAFVGSKQSNKYHTPACKFAANITKENMVSFASEDEAKKAGYAPCQVCCKTSK